MNATLYAIEVQVNVKMKVKVNVNTNVMVNRMLNAVVGRGARSKTSEAGAQTGTGMNAKQGMRPSGGSVVGRGSLSRRDESRADGSTDAARLSLRMARGGFVADRTRRVMTTAVITFVLIVSMMGCAAGRLDPDVRKGIATADSVVKASVDAGVVPGAVLLVTSEGVIVHREAYGYASRFDFTGEPLTDPVPMTTETVFDLASLTKAFATTLAIMKLVDDGSVELDAPVKTYLPAFSGAHKDSVRVRHLLAHTSGLYQWKPLYYHASTSEATYEYIVSLPLEKPVGKQRSYSDLGFMLLGYIVEEVSGQRLDRFVEEVLYTPLRLQATAFDPRSKTLLLARQYAATSHGNPFELKMVADDNFGYKCEENVEDFSGWRGYTLDGEVNDGNAHYANGGISGHAGLFATATDLSVILKLLVNRGEVRGNHLISGRTIDTFLTRDEFGHGLGWFMSPNSLSVDELPNGSFGHNGFTGTYAIAMPAIGINVILLTNRQNGGVDASGRYPDVSALRRGVTEAFANIN